MYYVTNYIKSELKLISRNSRKEVLYVKVVLKLLQNSQENSFSKITDLYLQLYKKSLSNLRGFLLIFPKFVNTTSLWNTCEGLLLAA